MTLRLNRKIVILTAGLAAIVAVPSVILARSKNPTQAVGPNGLVVFGYNELGMHCMNEDFSEIAVLPPFNTLRAQVLVRGPSPDIVTEEADVRYVIPTNTRSADKTNFWEHAEALFGVALPEDVGLTGNTLAGSMVVTPDGHWEASGIPITPIADTGRPDPYPVAVITASKDNMTGSTIAVVPVSTELSCNLCHNTPGISTATDILRDHDALHGTNLEAQKPVLCASCHADNALGAPGVPGVPNMSSAMHTAHAPRMSMINIENNCYACHPGVRTQCQRDIHLAQGMQCVDCHGDMEAVGNPLRNPWVDEPRCSDCHTRPGFDFEQPGKLFKNSVGHGGVHCAACHGPPHAITPTTTDVDNEQAILVQGHMGVIDTCTACHLQQPSQAFFHSVDD